MASILKEYSNALVKKIPISTGTIVSKKGTVIVVSSNRGTKEFSVPTPDYYTVGSSVRFERDTLLGQLVPETNLERYSV